MHEGNKIFKDLVSVPLDHLPTQKIIPDTITIKIKNLDKNIHPLNYSLGRLIYLQKIYNLNIMIKNH